MAVQAQYPSNVLFLNRSVQEGKSQIGNNYSLQPQLGGGFGESFLDPTQILFNPGVGTNSRKRGREHTSAATTAALNPLISMQSQPQLIDLTQLHTPPQQQQQQQTNIVSTGLRLAFEDQSHQQQQQVQQQQRQQYSVSPQSSQSSILLKEDLASDFKQQQDEIEHFLRVQGEQLRRSLEEKRKRHYHALLGAAEETIARRLREKDTEVEKATRRNAELEARAVRLTAEARAWQTKARELEVTAATLQAQLQQVAMMNGGMNLPEIDEGGGISCGGEAEDAESAYVDPDRVVESTGPSCKACRNRFASVVLLPCRHLCLCRECDAVAQSCPLCRSIRSSSVEVFLC
ncbi:PREDICTED: BOI-related E3 ubiquitin-protein ligase 1-like [Nicotiana attenuata]|uniref:Boi-related e3 ubiquitin-protein ligase 2 n=1 Tax=Nicotiana attenuata TaxID=49451 RepID=A0A1J6KA04_NICAT|nr:PREDICTED: BOI-related E3 ubiquitin-protein ligase 1-like [Nicotiana attenuata]OIT26877.1 putative boi-related e3 ubiquitin-protein ligase 2 [Nicotiana attenuata]